MIRYAMASNTSGAVWTVLRAASRPVLAPHDPGMRERGKKTTGWAGETFDTYTLQLGCTVHYRYRHRYSIPFTGDIGKWFCLHTLRIYSKHPRLAFLAALVAAMAATVNCDLTSAHLEHRDDHPTRNAQLRPRLWLTSDL